MYKNAKSKPVYNVGIPETETIVNDPGPVRKLGKYYPTKPDNCVGKSSKAKRARKARAKMLKARAEAQAFNQSIWSTVAYRHGGRVNDPTVKSMLGQGKSETE